MIHRSVCVLLLCLSTTFAAADEEDLAVLRGVLTGPPTAETRMSRLVALAHIRQQELADLRGDVEALVAGLDPLVTTPNSVRSGRRVIDGAWAEVWEAEKTLVALGGPYSVSTIDHLLDHGEVTPAVLLALIDLDPAAGAATLGNLVARVNQAALLTALINRFGSAQATARRMAFALLGRLQQRCSITLFDGQETFEGVFMAIGAGGGGGAFGNNKGRVNYAFTPPLEIFDRRQELHPCRLELVDPGRPVGQRDHLATLEDGSAIAAWRRWRQHDDAAGQLSLAGILDGLRRLLVLRGAADAAIEPVAMRVALTPPLTVTAVDQALETALTAIHHQRRQMLLGLRAGGILLEDEDLSFLPPVVIAIIDGRETPASLTLRSDPAVRYEVTAVPGLGKVMAPSVPTTP